MSVRSIIIYIFIIILIVCCDRSGIIDIRNNDSDIYKNKINVGSLHNSILKEIHTKTKYRLNIDKIEFKMLFIESVNNACRKSGIQYNYKEEEYDKIFTKFIELKKNNIYNVFNLKDNNIEYALEYLYRNKYINEPAYNAYIDYWNNYKEKRLKMVIEDTCYPLIVKRCLEVPYYSEMYWDNYFNKSTVLCGWWSQWKHTIRECCLIASDFLGAVLASGTSPVGMAAGAALASIAFSVAWPV